MKERLLFLFKFFGAALGIVMVPFLAILSPIFAKAIAPPCIVPTSYHIARMHWIEKEGEMGWSGEVENAVEHLAQCTSDVAHLASQLLSDRSGTVVSLGMDLIVRESFDDGDQLLLQHRNDKRWNHNLAFNDEYARFLLVLWKMKKKRPITTEDREIAHGWSAEYFEKVEASPSEL